MDSGGLLTGFRISPLDPPVDLLESEVQRQSLTETRQRFLVTNESNQAPLDVKVVSKSCGCIGMTLDDLPLSVDESFIVNAGHSRQISLTVPVPLPGAFDAKTARFRLSRVGGVEVERAIVTHARVHRDLAVNPRRIELITGPGSEASLATVKFDWTHSVGGESPLPAAVISGALYGRVDVMIESAGETERISTRLRKDHLRMLVRIRDDSALRELDEPSGIILKLPDSSMTENVAVQIVDGRSLLTAREMSFGTVKSGSVSRRAFIVRAVDSDPIGVVATSISGSGVIKCQTQKELGLGRLLVTTAFHAESPGAFRGQLTLTPADGRHAATTVRYEAMVIP